jgi:hypothetical protein
MFYTLPYHELKGGEFMKYLSIIFLVTIVFLTVTLIPTYADQAKIIGFRATSIYGQNYASGFDKGYAAAWNACRTGDELRRWVRDWKHWVITNPAYLRGYNAGVKQALLDAEYLEKHNLIEGK